MIAEKYINDILFNGVSDYKIAKLYSKMAKNKYIL